MNVGPQQPASERPEDNDYDRASLEMAQDDFYQDREPVTLEEIRSENLRVIRDDAWREGYEACYRGEQKHSPYRKR